MSKFPEPDSSPSALYWPRYIIYSSMSFISNLNGNSRCCCLNSLSAFIRSFESLHYCSRFFFSSLFLISFMLLKKKSVMALALACLDCCFLWSSWPWGCGDGPPARRFVTSVAAPIFENNADLPSCPFYKSLLMPASSLEAIFCYNLAKIGFFCISSNYSFSISIYDFFRVVISSQIPYMISSPGNVLTYLPGGNIFLP